MYHSIISITRSIMSKYQTKMETTGAYHIHPSEVSRVWTIIVPLDLELIDSFDAIDF